LLLQLLLLLLLSECAPGYFSSGKQSCSSCPKGRFCPAGHPTNVVMDCPAGLATIRRAAVSIMQVTRLLNLATAPSRPLLIMWMRLNIEQHKLHHAALAGAALVQQYAVNLEDIFIGLNLLL
jgi:hypothetical protein